MANNIPKEVRIAFPEMIAAFEDRLSVTKNVRKHTVSDTEMERSGDVEWISVPHIATDVDGTPGVDTSASFTARTRLAVPVSLTKSRMVPFRWNDKEMRDAIQEKQLQESASQKLASAINVSLVNLISNEGTVVVTSSTNPVGYTDAAKASASLTRIGVGISDRCIGFNPDDAVFFAADLANRQRIVPSEITGKAYAEDYLGKIARFTAYEMDYTTRLVGAAGSGDTIDTTAGNSDYTPIAKDGNGLPVDNRTQTVTVSNTTGVKVNDCFTIAGCEEIHMVTKQPTGKLKTFRVMAVNGATSLDISPPITAASSSPTSAELDYKNCELTSTSATAAITYINTTTASTNIFWHKDSIKLVPGRYASPMADKDNQIRATLSNGVTVTLEMIRNGYTKETDFRVDIFYDVVNLNREMNGIMLFNQV